jgi:outer membrane receptor protein involved in Fe transport
MADGGVFLDTSLPLGNHVTFKAGARADWVTDRVDGTAKAFFVPEFGLPPDDFRNRDFDLWMAYGTLEWKVTAEITAVGGFGTGKRPPSLWELYAQEPLVGIVQSGLSSLTGNTNLKPEQLYQMDLGIKADYGWVRAGMNGFYSWVFDYITLSLNQVFPAPMPNLATGMLQGPAVVSPQSFRFYQFVNTNRASLAGGECYAEFDVTDYLTPFGTLSYVEGMDNTRDRRGATFNQPAAVGGAIVPGVGALGSLKEPLPGIPPLEATVGIRLHEPRKNPRYGMEFTARIVSAQNRFAESLFEQYTGGFTIYDVRSYWQVNKNLLLTAGVENLGDINYQEHLDYKNGLGTFQPGINFYCGFKLDY